MEPTTIGSISLLKEEKTWLFLRLSGEGMMQPAIDYSGMILQVLRERGILRLRNNAGMLSLVQRGQGRVQGDRVQLALSNFLRFGDLAQVLPILQISL
jgi:hypothetical protein